MLNEITEPAMKNHQPKDPGSARAVLTSRKRMSSRRFRFAISGVIVMAVLLGIAAAPTTPSISLQSAGQDKNAQLTSGGGVNGGVQNYQSSELWGGGSEVENCSVCSPSGLLAKTGGQSTQPGQAVDPVEGDFTTSQDLFSVPAIGGDLAMNMSYDSGLGTGERQAASPDGYFGYGWSSTMSQSLTISGSNVTVNQDNGSQTAFVPPSGSDSCPVGDYESLQKYTVPGSATAYCAADRTDAQLGWMGTYYQLDTNGGTQTAAYNQYGILLSEGNEVSTTYIAYNFDIHPNSGVCPGTAGVWGCFTEEDSAGRYVVAEINALGLVTQVTDPANRLFTFGYADGHSDLTSITTPAPAASGTSQTLYAYQTGAASPYNADMTSITNPDGNAEAIAYYSYGMVHTLTDPLAKGQTTYQYEDIDCATAAFPSDCTDSVQQTNVTYADGESDGNQYIESQLTEAVFGASGSGPADITSYGFTYNDPLPSYQDAATVEIVQANSASGNNNLTASISTDAEGNVVSYTDPYADTTTSMYNDTGGNNLDELCWTAPQGTSVTLDLSCSTPPAGATTYTYDALGHQLTSTDPLGKTTQSGYYNNGLLCWTAPPTVTAAGSACTNAGSSPNGAPTGATTYTYDADGNVLSTTVATGTAAAATTSNNYNADSEALSVIPPDGQSAGPPSSNPYVTAYVRNGDGSVQSQTVPGGLGTLVTSYTYDLAGNVLTTHDPAGYTTNTYDNDGRLCWSYRYSATSPNACSSPPTGSTVYNSYLVDTDAPTQVTDPAGFITSYAYSDKILPTSATAVTAWGDGSPASSITTYTSFDPWGNTCLSGPISTGLPGNCAWVRGDTEDTYDAEGQLQSEKDPASNVTSYAYQKGAFPMEPISKTDAMGNVTGYTYDADGNLTRTTEANTNVISTGYDADNRPCYVAPLVTSAPCASPPAHTGVTTTTYDAASYKVQMVDNYGVAGQVTDTYTHDASGNLTQATNDNGQTNNYSYNVGNQVTCVSYPVASGQSCSTSPSPSNSVVDDTYNAAGQLASTKDWTASNNVVSYGAYTPLSQVGTITYPAATTGESLTYTYDADGNVKSAVYGGTKIAGLVGGTDSWTPTATNRVGASSTLGSYASPSDTYDAHGRIATATDPKASGTGSLSGADTFTYNDNGEITQDAPPTGSATNFSYNADDELTSQAVGSTTTVTYAYDNNGNRCAALGGSTVPSCTSPTTSTVTVGWNAYNQLCEIAFGVASGCTSTPAGASSYTYDGDGLRMTTKTSSATQPFDWDTVSGGSIPLDIDDGTNAYIYGPLLFGGTAPIEQINIATGVASFIASTPSGVQAVFTGTSTPTLSEEAAYSVWGVQTIQSGSKVSPFGFQGSYTDPTGLIYLIDRYYDPTTDQFWSVDPEVAETGQPYAFTGDNPVNSTDPLGLHGWTWHGGAWHWYRGNKHPAAKRYIAPHKNPIESFLQGLASALPPILPDVGGDVESGGSADSLGGMSVAERIGGFRDMAKTKGNYGLEDLGFPATVDTATANALGAEWVGPNADMSSDQTTSLISSDGLKEYRFPSSKGYSDNQVANFEWRSEPNGNWMSNGHLNILNIAEE
jgi:RHS repeat-associated protein